jgi:hypothetical protein
VEPGDVYRELDDIDMPRQKDILREGVNIIDGYFHAVYLAAGDYPTRPDPGLSLTPLLEYPATPPRVTREVRSTYTDHDLCKDYLRQTRCQ